MLLKRLAEIESPSGKEGEIKSFVARYLEERGYDVVVEELFVAANPGSELIVATHLDTVAIKAPFSTDGVYAYGTGVCDAKASVAAMLEAADVGIDYTLAFFCDEEEGGKGSRAFVESWKHGSMAIVMEPTELKIACEHYGCLEVVAIVRGEPSHAALPEMGENAIEKCCRKLLELKNTMKISVLKICGGSDEYVVPDECRIRFDVLLTPDERVSDVENVLRGYFDDLEVIEAFDGFRSGGVADLLEKAIIAAGLEAERWYMPSWTDALNLREKFDVVVWGPGELQYCHTPKERIRLEEIEIAKRVLLKLNEFV